MKHSFEHLRTPMSAAADLRELRSKADARTSAVTRQLSAALAGRNPVAEGEPPRPKIQDSSIRPTGTLC